MLINDMTDGKVLFDPQYTRGTIPRDFTIQPEAMMADPSTIPLIDESLWDGIIEKQEREQSSLEHILRRKKIMPLDQNGFNYCWQHSVVHCAIALRAMMNQPFINFSAVGLAAKSMNGKNDGAWCGLGAKNARELGIPLAEDWPQDSRSMSHDKPGVWENAAKYKTTLDYYDLTKQVWDQKLKRQQIFSCLLQNIPCALDFNWWGHSVMGVRVVKLPNRKYGVRILNSWYAVPKVKPWGDGGFATLEGDRADADGAVAVQLVTAA